MKSMEGAYPNNIVKEFSDHSVHFIERLRERYEMSISPNEYEQLCKGQFYGAVSKNTNKTVGYILINEIKVWVLYRNDIKCFATCYPPSVESNIDEAIRACFGSGFRKLAFNIWRAFLDERHSIPKFESDKEAGLYLFKKELLFPSLHMDIHKYGKVNIMKAMGKINSIINGDHEFVSLVPVYKKPPLTGGGAN